MRLEQAFGNLLSNASKFTKRGGRIWLSVEKSDTAHPAGEVIVRVRDEGAGIAADLVPDVFTLFTQAGSIAAPRRADLASDWRSSAASSSFIAAA